MPTASLPATVEYACSIVFDSAGVRSVIAEYTGPLTRASRGSPAETHTTIDLAFTDGFEQR